jgi:hypothetical protein
MATISTCETSVNFYQTTLRNIPQDSRLRIGLIRTGVGNRNNSPLRFAGSSLMVDGQRLDLILCVKYIKQDYLNTSTRNCSLGVTI